MSKILQVFLFATVLALGLFGINLLSRAIQVRAGIEVLNARGAYLTGCATLVLSVVAIFASVQGLRDNHSKTIAEKAAWLLQLYERLFDDSHYNAVRQRLDYDDTAEIITLIKMDRDKQEFSSAQRGQFDAFTDYLTFLN